MTDLFERGARVRALKEHAADCVLRALAHDGQIREGALLNANGVEIPALNERRVGPHIFYPARALAEYALDKIPEPNNGT